MIDAKVEDLFEEGKYFDARIFAALKHWFMRGLAAEKSLSGLDAAREMFRWCDDATEAAETRKTGVGLIFFCAFSSNLEAILALAPSEVPANGRIPGTVVTIDR